MENHLVIPLVIALSCFILSWILAFIGGYNTYRDIEHWRSKICEKIYNYILLPIILLCMTYCIVIQFFI